MCPDIRYKTIIAKALLDKVCDPTFIAPERASQGVWFSLTTARAPGEGLVGQIRSDKMIAKTSMLFRTAIFLFLIYGINAGATTQNTSVHAAQDQWLDTEGLYYLDTKQNSHDLWAFVITRQGQTIPPKENDPDAPTKPGFYIGTQHYRFINYSVTRTGVSFETVKIKGRAFRFRGNVRRRTVCEIENVPELRGLLTEVTGATQKQTKVRFGQGVVC